MPTYRYVARKNDGTLEDGTIDARSPYDAGEELGKMGMIPETLVESSDSSDSPLKFSDSPWVPIEKPVESVSHVSTKQAYLPILETLKLYAGWLLAWYAIVYAIGSYQFLKDTPVQIPFVESLFLSPLVLTFTLATFLFLLSLAIHRAIGGGLLKGALVGLIAVALFVLYRMGIAF